MKAVIVEIEGKHAIALNKSGEFVRIKNKKSYQVGYEIETGSVIRFGTRTMTRITSIAAALIFVVTLGYGAYSYSMPYSYVNIDINPSVEITVNLYDRIIKAEGLNTDGDKLLSTIEYRNRKLEDGISNILESATQIGYFNDDSKNAVMFTVSGKDQEKVAQIENEIQGIASKAAQEANTGTEIMVENVTLVKHDEAEKMGISPGKLSLIEKLREYEPQLTVNDLKDKPVKEINKRIKEDIENSRKDNQNKTNSNSDSRSGSSTVVSKTGKDAADDDKGKGNDKNDRTDEKTAGDNNANSRDKKFENRDNNKILKAVEQWKNFWNRNSIKKRENGGNNDKGDRDDKDKGSGKDNSSKKDNGKDKGNDKGNDDDKNGNDKGKSNNKSSK